MPGSGILLKGGTIVSGRQCERGDVRIKGEVIAEIAEGLEPEAGESCVDVSGKLLFPGFIDAHTHFDLHVAGTVTADDFISGSRAAILGGTTTVIDFATQYKGETLHQAAANWHERADGRSSCDYAFHLAISDWNDIISTELEEMVREGIPTYKLYMTYEDMMVTEGTIAAILARLTEVGGLAGVHCEDDKIVKAYAKRLREDAEARGQVSSHYKARPDCAEAAAVKQLLDIAGRNMAPVMIVHLTSQAGYEEVRRARERGQTVLTETCPQYLLLQNRCYESKDFQTAAGCVIAPPLRTAEDNSFLWERLSEGDIQTVATDHCSFTLHQKAMGMDDFTKIPGGMPGVETRAVLLYEYGVRQGRITVNRLCELLSENAARIYGLYPQKGVIGVGSDADIIIFDTERPMTIRAAEQASKAGYTPYEGMEVNGSVASVYLRGRLVAEDGQVIVEKQGKYCKRKPFGIGIRLKAE